MICKILVPVRGDGKGDNVFAHAAALAKRFKAHIVTTYCRARPEDMLPFGVPVPGFVRDQIVKEATKLSDVEEATLREEFEALAKKLDIAVSDKPISGQASASWVARPGRQIDIIKHYGRLADIICVAKPDRDRNLGANTLKAALFHTGRPVLMCPPTDNIPEDLGSNVAIAWNGSTEGARAVALSISLIDESQSVNILTAGEIKLHGTTAGDLRDYLAMRGIEASITEFENKSRVGEALLGKASEIGANLMIMGAYGDSHEKETILGGNTQTIVDKAEQPVLLIH